MIYPAIHRGTLIVCSPGQPSSFMSREEYPLYCPLRPRGLARTLRDLDEVRTCVWCVSPRAEKENNMDCY